MKAYLMVKIDFETLRVVDARVFSSPNITVRLNKETWLSVSESISVEWDEYEQAKRSLVGAVRNDPTLQWLRPWIEQHEKEENALVGTVLVATVKEPK